MLIGLLPLVITNLRKVDLWFKYFEKWFVEIALFILFSAPAQYKKNFFCNRIAEAHNSLFSFYYTGP